MWLLFLVRLVIVFTLLYGVYWLFDREYNSPIKQEEERRRKLDLEYQRMKKVKKEFPNTV